jgi:hypothetical protein
MIVDIETPFVAVGGLENRSPEATIPPGFAFAANFEHDEVVRYTLAMRESWKVGTRNYREMAPNTGNRGSASIALG